jgi:hypothetical protein
LRGKRFKCEERHDTKRNQEFHMGSCRDWAT